MTRFTGEHIQHPFHKEFMNSLLKSYENYFCCNFDSFDSIMPQRCTCHVACATLYLWHGLIIILYVRAKHIFARFGLWAHNPLVQWVPCLDMLDRRAQVACLPHIQSPGMMNEIIPPLWLVQWLNSTLIEQQRLVINFNMPSQQYNSNCDARDGKHVFDP